MHGKFIRTSSALLALGLTLWGSGTLADSNLKIISPADGSTVRVSEPVNVVYDITPNAGGDHSHIYVDGKETGVLRKLKSSFSLDPLPTGTHTLCLKVVNKGHASIGQESCIKVTAQ
ncbi:MAG: Ig-like domain-containing protein [Pseudomonadota bacterium]